MDAAAWLKNLGLGQYEAAFRDNAIDGDLLASLTAEDLKDLGVTIVGHRRKLLDAIAALGAAPKPGLPPAAAEPPATLPAPASRPQPTSVADAERRPITVMFCDLVDSTALASRLDAEDWRNLVNAYLDQASAAVTDFGGHVLKKLGDGLMALFGYPKAQESDAERAVRAALAIQRAIGDLNERNAASGVPELAARIGLESGLVVVDATGEVFGETPNVAARVQAAAEPGSVLVTGSVQRQVAGLFVVEEKGAHELKGVAQPLSLYRVIRASGAGRRGGARALTSFVGREEDLGTLIRRWERARTGEGQLVLIVGEPGLGKSRLIEEFRARLAETPHTWVEWSASQLLQNTPLHPIAEWGRLRFRADAPAEERLADLEDTLRLIGLDPAEHAPLLAPLVDIPLPLGRAANFPPEELRRRQLAAMIAWFVAGARSQPVVLAFEDLHWADPTSLDLLRAFADRGAQAPLLVLATTRPEFRAPWGMRSHHAVVALAPLDPIEVRRMVGEIAAQHALPQEVVERVSERTGGVPLFVEEVTRLLVERGDTGSQAVPPTLQQSLAARLDRLGPAREVAQIGAVLGRDFDYGLLRDVAETNESTLRASLDRLADADLLFIEGAPPEAKYRFKHALIQDAAYELLLKSRRQALHRRAAEALVEARGQPETIARHFTEAGLDELATEWWGKAGDQALRRSAFQEAIIHLGKAIAMADKDAAARSGAEGAAIPSPRIKLQSDYSQAMGWSKGFAARETRVAIARAAELAGRTDDFLERFAALQGQWGAAITGGELRSARELAQRLLREAEDAGGVTEAGTANWMLGLVDFFHGDLVEARAHCERALDARDPIPDRKVREWDGTPHALSFLAATMWQLGEVERARELIEWANRRASEVGDIRSIANALYWKSYLEIWRSDPLATLSAAEALERAVRELGMMQYINEAELHSGWARGRINDPMAGAAQVRRVLAAFVDQGVKVNLGFYNGLLAQLEAETLGADSALARIDEAFGLSNQVEHRCSLPFLHRLRGEVLLKCDPAAPDRAGEAYRTAIAIAKEQGARSPILLASLGLAKLYQSTNRPADAHAVLAPALEGFSLTAEMPEIAQAQALLAVLAGTDEVKAELAQRRQMAQLRVAYGNALIAARGYGAPETTEAFARARESTAGDDENAPGRLAADYGLWVSSATRGELPSMRAHAAVFLSDVEGRPESPEAGIAHRAAGITCWFAGEYREARDHLERALALFQAGRDDDLTFRFGIDPGVGAMAYLAIASWPLGEVDRALSLIDRMQKRMAGLTHVSTLAFGRMHAGLFELMRGDDARATPNAFELAHLAREHDLNLWRAFGVFMSGWATAAGGAVGSGLEDMRRGAELLREQDVLWFDGLMKIALAEAEARAGDPARAIAVLDEKLATCDRTGDRMFEAELHRARGEILLKRDLANTAPAEESFLTAIAIAKRQGTRSFGLRAALSLAKMYRSTSRLADARAVLAPALEGFSPTPEMPEIAEAQALIAALAETEEVKAAEAQRQRRLHLQTAYGQAMMMAKGYAAEETRAAFARATELAGRTHDFSKRFAALMGQYAAASTGGELRSARDLALTLLREAEDAGRAREAAFANFWLGLVAYWRGGFAEARTQCERALAAPDLNPDPKAWETSVDLSSWVSSCLAAIMWQLGEFERARELIDFATHRATDTCDISTIANALFWKSYLELWRGDPLATLSAAQALEVAAREHRATQYLNEAELHSGWARGRIDDPIAGAAQVRRVLAAFVDQGVRVNLGFYTGLLAQLEAETLGAESALARIDEALRLSDQVEHRCSLPFLHRLRGQILLKRDPANPAPAEEAFQTAIAIAKEQGAHSPVLLASLALARLYQSTNRPVDAHAVLAPALEGIAPTPEMPEIADAQALLLRLA